MEAASRPAPRPLQDSAALRGSVEDVIVELHTDTGAVGYGETPPTGVITGDTTGAIIGAIRDHIAPAILGRDLDEFEDLTAAVRRPGRLPAQGCRGYGLWDLLGQVQRRSLHRMLGGARSNIVTGHHHQRQPLEMAGTPRTAIQRGYDCLKSGVLPTRGWTYGPSGRRPRGRGQGRQAPHRRQSGVECKAGCPHPRPDAGEGITDIEFVKQPVPAGLTSRMPYVRHASVPVLAGEACVRPGCPCASMQTGAADFEHQLVMRRHPTPPHRLGGRGLRRGCMVGCMEAKVSINAAVELACARYHRGPGRPVLCSETTSRRRGLWRKISPSRMHQHGHPGVSSPAKWLSGRLKKRKNK